MHFLQTAVQQERKPPDTPTARDRSPGQNIATSAQKIYIRKALSSRATNVPMFGKVWLIQNGLKVSGGDWGHRLFFPSSKDCCLFLQQEVDQDDSLLANLQERLVQTEQGTVVLNSSSNTNTGQQPPSQDFSLYSYAWSACHGWARLTLTYVLSNRKDLTLWNLRLCYLLQLPPFP